MQNLHKLYFFKSLVTVFIFLASCGKKEKNLSNDSNAQNIESENIVVYGKSDDITALKYINFINYQPFGDEEKKYQVELFNNSEDSIKIIFPKNDKPIISSLIVFGDSSRYRTRLFLSPSDTIFLKIQKKQIWFEGKNGSENNFFKLLDSTDSEWAQNDFNGNFKIYKKNCDSIYKRRVNFFKNYVTEHVVSKEFEELVGNELKYEYYYNLISPRKNMNSIGLSVNEDGGILNALSENYNIDKNGFFNLSDYLGNITIDDFNHHPELINSDYFRRSLTNYIRYYFINAENLPYTLEAFESEKEFIENNLEGEIKSYSTFKLVEDYLRNGFGNGQVEKKLMLNLLESNKVDLVNSGYSANKINELFRELQALDLKLPDRALNEQLLTLKGDSIQMKDILKRNKGKIKVIDFWASWCKPCLEDFQHSLEIRRRMSEDLNLEWVYISVENDFEKWYNNSIKNKDLLISSNQFKIIETNKSKLLEDLRVINNKIVLVPKYIIIDSSDKIITMNSPRPSDSLKFTLFIKNIVNQ